MTWLHEEIETGLTMLAALNWERPPSREPQAFHLAVPPWATGPMADRVWDAERDIPRLRTAFARMLTACRAWPSPREFLDYLPPVEQKQLAHKPVPANPAKVQAMIQELADALCVNSATRSEPEQIDTAAAEAELKQHYADRKTLAAGGNNDA